MENRGFICAVCVSAHKGEAKNPVDVIRLRPGHGIEGDAHAGQWHRQVSLLARESVEKLEASLGRALPPGVFAENVLCRGVALCRLPVGTRLRVGTAVCQITQIGKECHADCAIRRQAGDCVMPREGVFAVVLTPGEARAGDEVEVLP